MDFDISDIVAAAILEQLYNEGHITYEVYEKSKILLPQM